MTVICSCSRPAAYLGIPEATLHQMNHKGTGACLLCPPGTCIGWTETREGDRP